MKRKMTTGACLALSLALLLCGAPLPAAAQAEWDSAAAVTISLAGQTATADGPGVTIDGSTVTITAGGVYVLSGALNGSVVVTAPKSAAVQLVLAGATIQADRNAAIYCSQADSLTVTLAEGTENSLIDATDFTYADAGAEEPDAALFSKVDLAINGAGQLSVLASFHNGIGTKDDLVIDGGDIAVTAANHGIRGRDSVTVRDGHLTITAGADGIQSNNADKGSILLAGGDFTIDSANDCIQAESTLSISGGTYTLRAGGGHEATPADTTGSYKGLKAGTDIDISGGSFAIDTADDAVHANGSVAVSGGQLTITTGDDGVHADADITVTGGAIDIQTCYEGMEATAMTVSAGEISIQSTDDGINIAGGNDAGEGMGRFGMDHFSAASADQWLRVTGGTITIVAGSDAVDINGSGEMTGGVMNLTAATLGEGQTLDVDMGFTHTGGDLTETGGSGFGGGGFGGGGGRGGRQP